MLKSNYYDYIYKVDGETVKLRPEKIFEPKCVYLIVDKGMKLIWIWAGSQSRLFHRYMAANWAGKLKTKKKFYNFKYEVIKQGLEPNDFHIIFNEIRNKRSDLNFPGQSRYSLTNNQLVNTYDSSTLVSQMFSGEKSHDGPAISKSVKSQIRKILSEIKEIQLHVKYSIDHIEERFAEIEKLLEK